MRPTNGRTHGTRWCASRRRCRRALGRRRARPVLRAAKIETDAHRQRVVDGFGRVADAAADAGVTLAMEYTLAAGENAAILDEIGSDAVGVYYDVGNAAAFGYDPAVEIRELGDRIAQVHFKDTDRNGASVTLGEGDVDFAAVVKAPRDIGYDDYVVLEHATTGGSVDVTAVNLAFARDALS